MMYNIKILNEACKSIIWLADKVSGDRRERSMVYHLLKFIRAAARDFPNNNDDTAADLLNAYAAKIKRSANGEISKFEVLIRHANYEKSEVIPMPIVNANEAVLYFIRQNLKERNRDNYSAVHKIADLYLHRFFEYSDWLYAHSEVENWKLKHALLNVFTAEMGLHISWLETAMWHDCIEYEDIIV